MKCPSFFNHVKHIKLNCYCCIHIDENDNEEYIDDNKNINENNQTDISSHEIKVKQNNEVPKEKTFIKNNNL